MQSLYVQRLQSGGVSQSVAVAGIDSLKVGRHHLRAGRDSQCQEMGARAHVYPIISSLASLPCFYLVNLMLNLYTHRPDRVE